jgi:hypothetical protein
MYKDGDALAKNYRSEMEANIKEQNEKTIGELKQEWGKDYDNRMEDARKAFKDMGLEEDVHSCFNSPIVFSFCSLMFASISER